MGQGYSYQSSGEMDFSPGRRKRRNNRATKTPPRKQRRRNSTVAQAILINSSNNEDSPAVQRRTKVTRKKPAATVFAVNGVSPAVQSRTKVTRKKVKHAATANTVLEMTPPVNITISDSDECDPYSAELDSSVIITNVQSRVENAFRDGGLISDEDNDSRLSALDKLPSTASCSKIPNNCENVEEVCVDGGSNHLDTLEDIEEFRKQTECLLKSLSTICEKYQSPEEGEEISIEKKDSVKEVSEKEVKDVNQNEKRLGECPICLDSFAGKQVYSTMCGHLFCQECILKVAKLTKKCPTCRKGINLKKIFAIYI